VFEREASSDMLLFSPNSRNVLKGKASFSFSLTYFMVFSEPLDTYYNISNLTVKKEVHTAAKQGVAFLL
jgi:hypothetical protein